MPRTGSPMDFDNFDEWETLDLDDDIYAGTETDKFDDWEDDGAIAQVRESFISDIAKTEDIELPDIDVQLDEESAQVVSLLGHANAKRNLALETIIGPSEDELSTIEEVGIDEYIDIVLAQDEEPANQTKPDIHLETEDETAVVAAFETEDNLEETDEVEIARIQQSFGDDEAELVIKPFFKGIACPLPTLFDEDGDVEYKTTARLAKRICENGATAIFVATLDGEGATLSRKERKTLVSSVSKLVDVPVVVEISSPSTKQSVQLSSDCKDAGANAFVIDLNSSIKDPYVLCESIHNKNPETPLIVRLSGPSQDLPISPEFLYDLPIHGVIDATGDAAFYIHLTHAYTGPIYVGSIPMLALTKASGASGVVLSSVAMDIDQVTRAADGDYDAVMELSALEREFGGITPLRIKQSLEMEMLISPTVRD